MTAIVASNIKAGDVLVDNTDRLTAWDDAEDSSAMPGLTRVECAFGTLYFDPETEVEIE